MMMFQLAGRWITVKWSIFTIHRAQEALRNKWTTNGEGMQIVILPDRHDILAALISGPVVIPSSSRSRRRADDDYSRVQ